MFGATVLGLQTPTRVGVRISPATGNAELPIEGVTVRRRSDLAAALECATTVGPLVVNLSDVSHEKAEHADWAAASNLVFDLRGARVRLPAPTRIRSLELSVDNNDHYELRYLQGERVLGRSKVAPRWNGGGLARHHVNAPKAAQDGEVDAIWIVPSGGDRVYSLGHLLVRPEP